MQDVGVPTSASAADGLARLITSQALDRLEQAGILALWSWLYWRVIQSPNQVAWLALISESTIMVFVLLRRPTANISRKIDDWALAMLGSFAPGLVVIVGQPWPGTEWLAVTMVLAGEFFQIWAKLTLRRSFGIAPANRGVKTGGPYKVLRHPMYTGYCVAQLGVLLALPSTFNLLLFVFTWSIQIVRLKREEALLGNDPSYREMMHRVRWRLLPGVY